jgi:hypothetical protein
MQRIQLLRSSSENWKSSERILLKGEVCLVMNETETGYNSLVIGDGQTMAKSLDRIFLGVKDGSVFLGIANPSTDPGIPAQNSYFITNIPGVYGNFGGLQVNSGELAFLCWQGSGWNKLFVALADDRLDTTSSNPIQNKVVASKFEDLERKVITGIKVNGVSKPVTENTVNLTVDSSLSGESENPIMNRVVHEALGWYED